MALQIDTVAHACNLITREIRDFRKNLTVHFIVHHEGQRTEALGMAAQDILAHPAAETATHLLQKIRKSRDSQMLGTAVARETIFFGLATRDSILSLCTINIDEFNSLKDARRQAYHLAWHALDAAEYHSRPENRTGRATEVIVRRRNALEMADANMRADVFASVMTTFHRDSDAIKRTGQERGLNALHTRSMHAPEYYPYLIAMEATRYARKEIDLKKLPRKRLVPTALTVAKDVAMTFDEIALKNWFAFSESAQDMAWRGYKEAEILSAAINTSPNTYVRAIGYQIAEICSIEPASIVDIRESYSPYADDEFNEKLHNKIIDSIYQDIIAQDLKQNSGMPFLNMANKQNMDLTEGKIVGWCAPSLQAAGNAFDHARQNGGAPEEHVAREFAINRRHTGWDDIKELGQRIIKTHRTGKTVTLSDLKDLSKDIENLKALRQSVEKTLSDPQYKQQLAAANELDAKPPSMAPAGPAIAAKPAPQTPSYEATAIPAMGGRPKVQTHVAQTAQRIRKQADDQNAGESE